jgi:hypothetical protein
LSTGPNPSDQWHLPAIKVAEAESRLSVITASLVSPTIAVIEADGIDTGHPVLPGATGVNFHGCDDEAPVDLSNLAAIPSCVSTSTISSPRVPRHGTAVSALAVTSDASGAVRGVCVGCKLLPIVYESTSDIQAGWALEWAAQQQADVVNWTQGSTSLLGEIQAEAPGLLRALDIDLKDVPVIMSAGNEGGYNPCDRLQSRPNVIAVGASNHRDWGIPAAEGSCLSILAPGGRGGFLGVFPPAEGAGWRSGIVTADARVRGYNPDAECSGDYDDENYTNCFGGTSAAAPIVAGVAGLLLQVNPNFDVDAVRHYLETTADKIDYRRALYDVHGHSTTHGYGRVNACSAVRKAAGDAGLGNCSLDAYPRWTIRLLALVPIVGFGLCFYFFGLCHPLTWIAAAIAAGFVTFVVASRYIKPMRTLHLWLAMGVAVIVLLLFWLILC